MPRSVVSLLVCFAATFSTSLRGADPALPDGLYAEIATPRGVVTCELSYKKTPLTVANFVGLAEGTLGSSKPKSFFDGLTFHRVVPGFVVQGGDPLGNGDGGPGRSFPDEFFPGLRHDTAGVLSMANSGPDSNGSQFFLTLAPVNRLNYLHSVFGRTVHGVEVLPKIVQGDTMNVKILRVGAAARAFRADETTFAALGAKVKKYSAAGPGPAAHFDDPAALLPLDPPRAKAFNYKLANFERATGVRLVARLLPKAPPAAEDATPGAYMHALAEQLGTANRGALAVYFADADEWRVWFGDESAATFLGGATTPNDLKPEGKLHEAKQSFLMAARADGDREYLKQQKNALPEKPLPRGQSLKLQTDALLDGLITRLEPK